jgi:hypothetical protein
MSEWPVVPLPLVLNARQYHWLTTGDLTVVACPIPLEDQPHPIDGLRWNARHKRQEELAVGPLETKHGPMEALWWEFSLASYQKNPQQRPRPYAIATCPFRHVGREFYLTEPWTDVNGRVEYFYDTYVGIAPPQGRKWRSAIRMKREYARVFVRIEEIGVRQVWDITKRELQALDMGILAEYEAYWNARNYLKGVAWEQNPWEWVARVSVTKGRIEASIDDSD